MKTSRDTTINIRVDHALKTKLFAEARQRRRTFSDHVRAKLADEDSLDASLETLERRTQFTVLALCKLFEGLDRKDDIDALMDELDSAPDPLAEAEPNSDKTRRRTES